MPASSAAWIVAMLSRSSAGPYIPDMPMHPSANGNTAGPAAPSFRIAPSTGSDYESIDPIVTIECQWSFYG